MDGNMASARTVSETLVDPVCGMAVSPESKDIVSSHKGKAYYFCSEGCRKAFEKNPEQFVKPKGVVARFIHRMAKSNEDLFGSKGPRCCR